MSNTINQLHPSSMSHDHHMTYRDESMANGSHDCHMTTQVEVSPIDYDNEEEDPVINNDNYNNEDEVLISDGDYYYEEEEEEEEKDDTIELNGMPEELIITNDGHSFEYYDRQQQDDEFPLDYYEEEDPVNFNDRPLNYHDLRPLESFDYNIEPHPLESFNEPHPLEAGTRTDSTTEELETLPGDSTTTTDAGGGIYHDHTPHNEAIGGCVTYTSLQKEKVFVSSSSKVGGVHSYENWSIIMSFNKETEDGSGKRKRVNHSRLKGSRVPMTRPRPPQPLPRSNNTKVKMPRPPAPLPRKRRISTKVLRPLSQQPQGGGGGGGGMVTSEGDMAQADEMGDERGQDDDGFVDCNEPGGGRRRRKRQQGVAPILSTAVSPPSSPLNTPHSSRRRVTPSRKGRTKQRQRRPSKPVPASADISTQETTTPGPASSETDDSELGVVEEVELATPIHRLVVEEEEEEIGEMSARIVHKTTPPTTRTTPTYARPLQVNNNNNGVSGETFKKPRTNLTGKRPPLVGGVSTASNNETSDTELTSTSALSVSSKGRRKIGDTSDLSTAPLSSDETSDNVSESEKGQKVTTSGIPRPSPTLPRKVTPGSGATPTQPLPNATSSPRTPLRSTGTRAGNFVSKRSSVSAMISQFDKPPSSAASEGPGSPKLRPHPQIRPSLSAKPNLKPKPSPRQTTPPKQTTPTVIKQATPSSDAKVRVSSCDTSEDSAESSSSNSGEKVGGVKSGQTKKSTESLYASGATKPVGGATKPVGGGTTKPVGGATKSVGGGTAKPMGGATKPVGGGTTKQVGGATKPVGGATKPVGGATKPVGGITKPVGGINKPVGGARKLSNDVSRLRKVTPPANKGRTTPSSSEGKATPPLSKGRTTPSSSDGKATPPLSKERITPTSGEGKATPPLNKGRVTPSINKATPPLSKRTTSSTDKTTPPLSKRTTSSTDKTTPPLSKRTTPSIDKATPPLSKKTTPSTNESKAMPSSSNKATPTSVVPSTNSSSVLNENDIIPISKEATPTTNEVTPIKNEATSTNETTSTTEQVKPTTEGKTPPLISRLSSATKLPSLLSKATTNLLANKINITKRVATPTEDKPTPTTSSDELDNKPVVTEIEGRGLKETTPTTNPVTTSDETTDNKTTNSSTESGNKKETLRSRRASPRRPPPEPPVSPTSPLPPSTTSNKRQSISISPPPSSNSGVHVGKKELTSKNSNSGGVSKRELTSKNSNSGKKELTFKHSNSNGVNWKETITISHPIPISDSGISLPSFNKSGLTKKDSISPPPPTTKRLPPPPPVSSPLPPSPPLPPIMSGTTKRLPPPPPPVSSPTPPISSSSGPTKSITSTTVPKSSKPQNYEEFIPTLIRSGSLTSQPSSPPPLPVTTPIISHYEGVDFDLIREMANKKRVTPSSSDSETPPPLPPRNYGPEVSLPLTTFEDREGPATPTTVPRPLKTKSISVDACSGVPPPLPSQPIPKRKSTFSHSTFSPLLKRKEITVSPGGGGSGGGGTGSPPLPTRSHKVNLYEEITLGPSPHRTRSASSSSSLSSSSSKKIGTTDLTQHYEVCEDFRKDVSSGTSYVKLSPSEDPRRFSASICVTNSLGVSPVSLRRANSDRQSNRIPIVVTPMEDQQSSSSSNGNSLQRTSSMDILDDRIRPRASLTDPGYSSGDEEEATVLSNVGLPQPPKNFNIPIKSRLSPTKQDPDEEPLYQYINHADFTSTPMINFPANKSRTAPSKSTTSSTSSTSTSSGSGVTNQLEIARQLSFNHRKLWCEQPEVIQSGVLGMISDQDRKLQEAMYEVLTSEASYLRSLNVLIEHFMDDPGMNPNLPEGRRVLDKRQHHVMFSNVREVQSVCSKFLKELQERQRESAISQNICDIILKYAEGEFSCYIPYCTNQVYQMRELTDLLENNIMFQDYLKRLEAHKRCQNLSLTSFLLLPMQRITRLPLLVLAILNRTPMDNPNHPLVEKALRTVQKLVTACNDGARQMERTEELHLIHKQLDFNRMKPFPLVSVSRQLERKGVLVLLQVEQRLFGKPRIKRTPVYVFVFTDYVLITKKKSNPKTGAVSYRVLDYASKAVVETVEKLKVLPNVSFPKHVFGEQDMLGRATWAVSVAEERNAFLLIFLENSLQKSEKYIMVTQNETDHTRWLEAFTHPAKEKQKEDEKIYETWDCPQVQAVYDYAAQQHDELELMRGDIVKVYRKMADGWYEGERLRDLQWGWFPSNFTIEVENAHTRARNLKERHRLLSLPFNPDDFLQHFNASN